MYELSPSIKTSISKDPIRTSGKAVVFLFLLNNSNLIG